MNVRVLSRPARLKALCSLGMFLCLSLCSTPANDTLESRTRAPWTPRRFLATRYTTESGLPESRVTHLAQSRDGYLWCATRMGLARFDGIRFTVFDSKNTPAFEGSDEVRGVATDGDDRLWVATPRSLMVREPAIEGLREVTTDGSHLKGISNLNASDSSGVWIMRSRQILRMTAESVVLDHHPLPTWASDATEIIPWPGGSVGVLQHWLDGHRMGWWNPTENHWIEFRQGKGPPSQGTLIGSSGPFAWAVRWGGLVQMDAQGHDTMVSMPSPLSEVGLLSGSAGRSHRLWLVAGDGSLWVKDAEKFHPIEFQPSLSLKDANCIIEDKEGTVWLGTSSGLVRLRPTFARTFTTRDGLPDENVRSVSPTSSGPVWAATETAIVRVDEQKVSSQLPPIPWAQFAKFISVIEDREGRVIAASSHGGGLSLWQHGAWTQWFPHIQDPVALYEDLQHRLWIGARKGAACVDQGILRGWGKTNGLTTPDVRVIGQTHDGSMWFGTRGGGLVRVNETTKEIRSFGELDGLTSTEVWTLHETEDGALWAGGNNGLHYLPPMLVRGAEMETKTIHPAQSGLAIITVNMSHGLAENAINWILDDGLGNFWLSGLRGIHQIQRQDLESIVNGRVDRIHCLTLGIADGLEGPETNGEQQPAGGVDRWGRLWFPSNTGIVMIDPHQLSIPDSPRSAIIEQVFVDGTEISSHLHSSNSSKPTILNLPPGEAPTLRIVYTAPTFTNPERVRFRHRLRGLRDEWEEAGSERVAYFTHLPPGNFSFELLSSDAHGRWQSVPMTLPIFIAPTLMQTRWFPVSLIGLGCLGVAGLFLWRLRWERRASNAESEQNLAEERARIAGDLHDELGTALTGIALELDVLRQQSTQAPSLSTQLIETSSRVRSLAERMREVVWAVNPQCDTVSSLAHFLEQQTEHALRHHDMGRRFSFPADIPHLPLSGHARHQLSLAVRESLNNAIRHSKATLVTLTLEVHAPWIHVGIRDNGVGFDLITVPHGGCGLNNMKARLTKIGGTLHCQTSPGAGTALEFRVPLQTPSARGGDTA